MNFPSLAELATREVVTMDVTQSLKEAVQLMNEHHIRDVIVTQGQHYFILTARELIDFQIRQVPLSTPLADLHLNIVPQMMAGDSVMKALMVIQNHPDNHVCLINEDKELIGIVSYTDLANSLQPDHLVQSQPVSEIVKGQSFLQVTTNDDLQTVFKQLHLMNETAAIVMQNQQAVGMITQTNVIALLNESHNWQQPVSDYMSSPLMTVDASASVQYALAVSREHHIKHIVVMEHDQVLGILHQKDLVALVYQALHQRFENENQLIKQEMDLLKAGPVVSLIWQLAPGWPVSYITPNVLKVLGYQASEVISARFKFSELIHPEDVDRVAQEVESYLAERAPFWEQRYRLLSKQGQWLWFYDYSQPIYDANEKVEAIFGFLLDQTHLVETEQALAQSERQYRSLFEHYPMATVLYDPKTQLPIRFNHQAHQQLGYSAETFAHLRIADYEVLESAKKVEKNIADILAKGGAIFETQHRHKSGQVLDIKVTVKTITFDDAPYLLSVFEDITALKQSQQALAIAHQKELAASEEKSKFMAYLSHELRTPLSGILGLCELTESYTEIADFKKSVTQVTQAAQQLMLLMNDLLDLSKIEAQKLTLFLQPMQLESVVEAVMALGKGLQGAKASLKLTLYYDAHLPKALKGDVQRLRQVLMNLLSNAVKFTQQGEVTLEVRLIGIKNDQAWVKFAITDTGIGISKTDLSQLFKPYQQAQVNSIAAGGTGLGLAISQQLVQLMQGKGIEVSSELGKGSCFAFEVPFEIGEPLAIKDPAHLDDMGQSQLDKSDQMRELREHDATLGADIDAEMSATPDNPHERLQGDELHSALQSLRQDLQSHRYLQQQQLQPLWVSLPESLREQYGTPLINAIEHFEFDHAIQLLDGLVQALRELGELD